MAKFTVISFEGDEYSHSLNKEATGPANIIALKESLIQRTGGDLEWSDSSIKFFRGDSFFEWRGNFSYKINGDIKSGSTVNEFERKIDGRYGRVLISSISYDAIIESGAFYSLTVPNEIRDILENANKSGYNKSTIESSAYPGWSYNFETIYDSGTEDTPSSTVDRDAIGRLYTAAFGRKPDANGLQFWVDVVNDPVVSYKDVSKSFVDSPEFSVIASPNSSSNVFVTSLYQNVLGRSPDSEGLSYWTNQFDSGLQDRADILIGFANSTENVALYETLI